MPRLPFIIVVIAAVLIVAGRLGRRWKVAVAGFVLLGVAAPMVLLGWGVA